MFKELRETNYALTKIKSFNNLTNNEKANLRRMAYEIGHFVAILGAIALLECIGDDDKEKSYFYNLVDYQLRRMKRELGVLIPGSSMVNEGMAIIKSPSAVLPTISNTLGLFNLLLPSSYTTILENGKYKDHSEAYRDFMNSPLSLFGKTISRTFEPEIAARWYK